MRRLLRRDADLLHLQWLAAPELDVALLRSAQTARLHRARPPSAPHRAAHAPLATPLSPVRPRRRPLRARSGGARRVRRRARTPARDPAPRLPERPGARRRRPHGPRAGRDPAVQGPARRDRVRPRRAGTRACSSPGDPRIPLAELRERGGDRVEWRLGYLGPSELEQALAEATVAVFPYRDELDQSGALLQALGAGVPAVVYDVGGLGEVVTRFSAGRVVPAGDVASLSRALGALLDDPDELAAAREGAERARETLTWDAAAAAHLDLYQELV